MKLLLAITLVASASAQARIRLRSSTTGTETIITWADNKLDIPQHTAELADARTRLAALEQKHDHFIQVTYEDRISSIETRLGIHREDINANDVDIANLQTKDQGLENAIDTKQSKADAAAALEAAQSALQTAIDTKQSKDDAAAALAAAQSALQTAIDTKQSKDDAAAALDAAQSALQTAIDT